MDDTKNDSEGDNGSEGDNDYNIDEFNSDDDIDIEDIINADGVKKNDEDDDDEEDEDELDENYESNINDNVLNIETTLPSKYLFITKYEYCRLIEALCKLIAIPTFNIHPDIPKDIMDIKEIAIYWINNKNIPFPIMLVRKHFNKKAEIINIRKLKSYDR